MSRRLWRSQWLTMRSMNAIENTVAQTVVRRMAAVAQAYHLYTTYIGSSHISDFKDGIAYNVPESIEVRFNDDRDTGTYLTFPSGGDASDAFKNDPSVASRFFAITGDSTVSASLGRYLRNQNQFAFFSFSQNKYFADLKDIDSLLDIGTLRAGILSLPMPFNSGNADTLTKYKQFFESYGTHVITKARYGACMQLVSVRSPIFTYVLF